MKNKIHTLALWFYLIGTAQAQFNWDFVAPMPEPRSGICSVVLNDQIYVLGGRDSAGSVLSGALIYNPESDQWQSGASLQIGRKNAAAVVKNDTIFVFGGRNADNEIESSVEFYAPANNEWLPFVPLQQKREGLSAVVLKNKIYALGGLTETEGVATFLNSVEFFNTGTSRWESVSNWELEEGMASFAGVAFDNFAFVLGGFSNFGPLNFVQRYHPDSGATTDIAFNNARGGLAATVRTDSILVIGGRNAGNSIIGTVEIYKIGTGFWAEDEPLLTRRENHAAVTVSNTTFVIGGQDAFGSTLASVEAKIFQGALTSVESKENMQPEKISLKQNYPNPFNASSIITFTVPDANEVTDLSIYNLQGRLVKNLVHGKIAAGERQAQWNGQDALGNDVASGIYIYAIKHGGVKISKKMLLVR